MAVGQNLCLNVWHKFYFTNTEDAEQSGKYDKQEELIFIL